jgi:RNA polymerase sigma-32 factor
MDLLSRWIDDHQEETQPLDREEQYELIHQWQEDNNQDALQTLIKTNIRFIVSQAKEFGESKHTEELVQCGVMGMKKAADKFDTSTGYSFLTYARWWMSYEFREFLKETEHTVRLTTRAGRKLSNKYGDVIEELREQKDVRPTPQDIADALDVSLTEMAKAQTSMYPIRLSEAFDPDSREKTTRQEFLASGQIPQDQKAHRKQLSNQVQEWCRKFVDTLDSPRSRSIWFERITAEDPKTLRELGEEWNVSKERIRQVESKIERQFRDFVTDRVNPEELDWIDPHDSENTVEPHFSY